MWPRRCLIRGSRHDGVSQTAGAQPSGIGGAHRYRAGRYSCAHHAAAAFGRPRCYGYAEPVQTTVQRRGHSGHRSSGPRPSEPPAMGDTLEPGNGVGRRYHRRHTRLCHRDYCGLLRWPGRQHHHARRRYADGLSLYPIGIGHCCRPWARSYERADRGGCGQRAVLCAQYSRGNGGDRA